MIRASKRWEASCDTCGALFPRTGYGTLALLHADLRRYGWEYKGKTVTCPVHPPQG